jgi:16S rRNA (guanine527-N7)-methyltransferase
LKVVEAIVAELNLKNVTTQHIRAEEIKNKRPARPSGGFDFVVTRAVAPLKDLWKWSKPLLSHKAQGTKYKSGLICLKGGDLTKEIQESNLTPRVIEINELFSEDYFKEKYILFIPV